MQASLIEYNLEAVDGAIGAVRGALAGGLNWKELKRLVKGEKEAGNPVASLIYSLELEQNRITLLLSNFLDEEEGDDDALTRPATKAFSSSNKLTPPVYECRVLHIVVKLRSQVGKIVPVQS